MNVVKSAKDLRQSAGRREKDTDGYKHRNKNIEILSAQRGQDIAEYRVTQKGREEGNCSSRNTEKQRVSEGIERKLASRKAYEAVAYEVIGNKTCEQDKHNITHFHRLPLRARL